jgi:hypothetical protein
MARLSGALARRNARVPRPLDPRLDPQSRRARLAMAVADDFLNQYAERCFGINDLICGYFAAGKMRAAAALRGFDSPGRGGV